MRWVTIVALLVSLASATYAGHAGEPVVAADAELLQEVEYPCGAVVITSMLHEGPAEWGPIWRGWLPDEVYPFFLYDLDSPFIWYDLDRDGHMDGKAEMGEEPVGDDPCDLLAHLK